MKKMRKNTVMVYQKITIHNEKVVAATYAWLRLI